VPTAKKPPTKRKAPASAKGGQDQFTLELLGQILQATEELTTEVKVLKHQMEQAAVEISSINTRARSVEKDLTALTAINERGAVLNTKLDDVIKRLG
jgi:predicted  nucleic acid-binding Zn-ribbon protein